MGGDGLNGLAVVIFIAAVLMFLGAAFIGYKIGGKVGAVLGAGIGVLAVVATFMESTWSPPLSVTIITDTPHETVLLVADPKAPAEVTWEGVSLPFFAKHATLTVPKNGVLRLRALGELDGGDVEAKLKDGTTHNGRAGLRMEDGGRLVAFTFVPWPGKEKDISEYDEAGLAQLVKEREAEH